MQPIHIFTSITANYLPKARVLATSIKRIHSNVCFHLVLCDITPQALVIENEPFDSIIPIEELPIPNRESWIFKHSIVEMCTGVKGIAFQEIFRRYNCDTILYFDPDIVVLSALNNLLEKLEQSSILLTPHLTTPEQSKEAVLDNEICSLQHGVFNLGFLGVKNSEEGRRFLDWWSNRCLEFCYDDIPGGLFTDQRWIDLVPAFFTEFHVLREPIYNVATWNLTHRTATGTLEQGILVNGEPLCFYHFSGFDSGAQEAMLKRYGSTSPVLFEFREWYIEQCCQMGQEELGQLPCFYSYFDNGQLITKQQRLLYRQRVDLQEAFTHPFSTTDLNHSYYHWYAQFVEQEETMQKETVDMPESNYSQLHQALTKAQAELEQAYSLIAAMESSKFWKIRKTWFRFKKSLGFAKDEQSSAVSARTAALIEPIQTDINSTSLNQEITWLKMEVEQLRKENEQFNSEKPYIAGTDLLKEIIPPIPPVSIRATVSSSSMAGYLVIADAWYFVLNNFIKENSTVLDIGCGCGKMARFLVANPFVKKYIGFDPYDKSIQWCQQNIAPFSDGRFEFYYLDIFSQAYNPNGEIKGTEVTFPSDDNSVDFALAGSVFTHLLEDDAKHYLKEVKRVLKKDGLFLPSIHTSPEPGTDYSGSEIRIDVDPEYFISLAEAAGLHLVKKPGILCGQEVLLFTSSS